MQIVIEQWVACELSSVWKQNVGQKISCHPQSCGYAFGLYRDGKMRIEQLLPKYSSNVPFTIWFDSCNCKKYHEESSAYLRGTRSIFPTSLAMNRMYKFHLRFRSSLKRNCLSRHGSPCGNFHSSGLLMGQDPIDNDGM